MKWLNDYRMRLWLVGFVAAFVLGGGRANADLTFGEPTNLGPTVNSSTQSDFWPCPSADGLELFFVSDRPGGEGDCDLWVTTRASMSEPWGEPANLGPVVNTSYFEGDVSLPTDGLELCFASNRPGGCFPDEWDIWMTTRPTRNSPWGEPVSLGSFLYIDSETIVTAPCLSADGLELYVAIGHAVPVHEWSIAVARRDSRDAPWGTPVRLGSEVNSWCCQGHQSISSDGLLLLFSDIWACTPRPHGFGDTDIWFTRRATKDGDWCTSMNLGAPVNTAFSEDHAKISADGSMLYFTSYRFDAAMEELYQAPIIPIVDFNADGKVDTADLVLLIDAWGTADTLYDIGPMPWGDGVVDIEDLKVFIKYWEQENMPGNPQGN